MRGARPFKRTQATGTGDMYDADPANANDRLAITMLGAKLVAGGAAATAELQDANGTTLALLSAPANGADWLDVPVIAEGKITLAAIAGAGSTVLIYVD